MRANLIRDRGELGIGRKVEMIDRKLRACRSTADHAQRLAITIAYNQSVNLRGRRQRSTDKVCQRRLAKLKAAASDGGRDEITFIDCSIKVPPQRSLLGGKPARDQAGRVFPHDATVGDPIDDQDRTDRKQHENTDAHDERRQQPESVPFLIQMISAAQVAGHHGRPAW